MLQNEPIIGLVVCVDKNYGIGKDGTIPWKSKSDMEFFKNLTQNSIVIMGKITYESIRVKSKTEELLKSRISVVVSSSYEYPVWSRKEQTYFTNSVNAAYNFAIGFIQEDVRYKNIFFIGGTGIYEACVPYLNRAYVNMLFEDHPCDTFFNHEILNNFQLKSSSSLGDNLISYEYAK